MSLFVICKYRADSYAALFTSHAKEEETFPTQENCFIVSFLNSQACHLLLHIHVILH